MSYSVSSILLCARLFSRCFTFPNECFVSTSYSEGLSSNPPSSHFCSFLFEISYIGNSYHSFSCQNPKPKIPCRSSHLQTIGPHTYSPNSISKFLNLLILSSFLLPLLLLGPTHTIEVHSSVLSPLILPFLKPSFKISRC